LPKKQVGFHAAPTVVNVTPGSLTIPKRSQRGIAATKKITPSLPSPLEGEGEGGGEKVLNKI